MNGFLSPCIRMTVLTRAGFSSWPYTSPQTTPSNRQRWARHRRTQTYEEAAYTNKVTVKHIGCLLPAKACHSFTLFSFLLFLSPAPLSHPPPPPAFLSSPSVFRLHLPQESTTQISTATAAFVLTFCDHSGLQLSPSPKVDCFLTGLQTFNCTYGYK